MEDGKKGKMTDNKICPKCGSKDYSMIFQGDVNASSKAFWECADCAFHTRDSKIESFDYDQGYNLDEVFDQ